MQTTANAVGGLAARKRFASVSIQSACGGLTRDIAQGRERGGHQVDEFLAERIRRNPRLTG